jgi:hypothetical protein
MYLPVLPSLECCASYPIRIESWSFAGNLQRVQIDRRPRGLFLHSAHISMNAVLLTHSSHSPKVLHGRKYWNSAQAGSHINWAHGVYGRA